MDFIFIWLLGYALPGLLAGFFSYIFHWKKSMSIINAHIFLLISISISLYFIHSLNLQFPWPYTLYPFLIYFLTILISYFLVGKVGLLYGISALIQESTMLFMCFILMQSFPLPLIIFMIIPLFVIAHDLGNPYRYFKILLLALGGGLSLYLFAHSVNILYITALHVLIGTWLIKKSLIYRFRPYQNPQ